LINVTCDAHGQKLINVTLASGITINNAILQGQINGDPNAPAHLENVTIKDYSHLSGIILNNTVQLGENVELTDLLAATAPPMECAALLTQIKRIDLSKDVFSRLGFARNYTTKQWQLVHSNRRRQLV
jgi:hypothetical protein